MATPSLPPPLVAGWHGKLPSHGDFVGQGLPPAWLRRWDDWLQRALAVAAQRWGPALRDRLMEMPAAQALVRPLPADRSAWCLVVTASADRVGRPFPLMLAEAYDAAALDAMPVAAWQARGEQMAAWLTGVMPRASAPELDEGVRHWSATPWPQAPVPGGATLAALAQTWPHGGSFWRCVDDVPEAGLYVQTWPPHEALILDWLA